MFRWCGGLIWGGMCGIEFGLLFGLWWSLGFSLGLDCGFFFDKDVIFFVLFNKFGDGRGFGVEECCFFGGGVVGIGIDGVLVLLLFLFW